jgi:integrase
MASAGATLPLTLYDAIQAVQGWHDLTDAKRQETLSALKTIAKRVGQPEGAVILTPAGLRPHLAKLEESVTNKERRRLYNIRSLLRSVLKRLSIIDDAETPISPAWTSLLKPLDSRARAAFSGFAAFCSARRVEPAAVDDGILAAFEQWLTDRTLTPRPRKRAGEVRSAWNKSADKLPGWPPHRFAALRQVGQYILPLEAFHPAFKAALDDFGKRLAGPSLDDPFEEGDLDEADDEEEPQAGPSKPLRASTIALRQSHARWAASALVATGVPIDAVTSLDALVTPVSRVREVLRYLHERAGRQASAGAMHVGELLHMVAKYHARLPKKDIDKIQEWRKVVQVPYTGMTQKNEETVRRLLEPANEARLIRLPGMLMANARAMRIENPRAAYGLAMRALAIEFLTRLPILRLENLIGIRLNRHLHRSDPPNGPFTYVDIQVSEVKNSNLIRVPVSKHLAKLIDEWQRDFRPIIAAPECTYLFPGHGTGEASITPQGFREAVKDTTRRHIGVTVTPHQFRHTAAKRFLKEYPGQYETLRRLLGHKDIGTTIKSYCSSEQESDYLRFDEMIEDNLRRRRHLSEKPKARRKLRTTPSWVRKI